MTLASRQLPRTAEGVAAAELRSAIVGGDLAPGEKILQEATAEEIGVSLIPLREALKTLASEGVVTYHPQRGYFVTELPVERIRELYLARDLVEAEVERLAVAKLDDGALEIMRAQVRAQRRAVAERDAVEMIAANRTFHFAIFELCGNPWLVRFVAQLWDALDPYRVLSYRRMWLQPDDELLPEEILAEHDRILGALESDDGEGALVLMSEHRARSEVFLAALTPGAVEQE
ncbi:MAG TPA: GntR family transcriptional regulator [Solirubrobacteraceae bacterium]|jgi:DNA-binding GntR family transcriptional regulator|nr:GntR family transcriptional regulator [Solirubrobacteraceae bacterium]